MSTSAYSRVVMRELYLIVRQEISGAFRCLLGTTSVVDEVEDAVSNEVENIGAFGLRVDV